MLLTTVDLSRITDGRPADKNTHNESMTHKGGARQRTKREKRVVRVTVVHVEITRQGRCEALRCRSSLRNPIKAYNSMWEGYRQHTAQIYCYPGTRSLEKQAGHCCLSVCAAQGGRAGTWQEQCRGRLRFLGRTGRSLPRGRGRLDCGLPRQSAA